ncbi:MAG: DUF445 domain-containing protein [Gemmatimonadaceae bacterium]
MPTPRGVPALSQPQPVRPEDEAERQRRLDQMKRWATGLLLASTAIFIVTHLLEPRYPWLGYVRATAEAAMVGGLADWFAVTALFKYPLGIPIPHTAIIPTRKDRVGATLGLFVQRNFLNPDVVAQRLASVRPAERIAHWMMEPESGRAIARVIARALSAGANVLSDDDVQGMIGHALLERIRGMQVAPILGRMLSVFTAGNRHQALLDDAIRLTSRAISENQDLIRERVESESPWWVPGAFDDRITRKIVGALDRTMQDVRSDPDHPLRQRFDLAIDEFIVKLQASPEVILKAEQLKEDILNADAVKAFSASLWADAKAAIARHAEAPEGFNPEAIQRSLSAMGEAILGDPVLMAKIDGWISEAVSTVVKRYEQEVADLIAHTVRQWDPKATSHRIELAIGRDLQFIRINGTLVGGLAGLLLYMAQRFF